MIQEVAVLGAGTMGSQIAAHFANAGFQVLLFDLADAEGGSSIALKSAQHLAKIDPAPLADPEFVTRLIPCNYTHDLARLKTCDLIIEAVAEDLAIKEKLYQSIAPELKSSVVLASNTSGLSIGKLAKILPTHLQPRFLGMHFFNPPRYLPLVELIPHGGTDGDLIPMLKLFLVNSLGKQVVKSHDTPNFIANRLGVFGLLVTLHHAERLNIPLDLVDQLTGKLIGRPKSATLRTLDLVGLDIFAHVVKTMTDGLANDPWHQYFVVPEWINKLIQNKALGQKTGKGIYEKTKTGLNVINPKTGQYQPVKKHHNHFLKKLKKTHWQKLWLSLAGKKEKEAQFLYAVFRDLFHYTAVETTTISDCVRDVDTAMRCGFGWKEGIYESWQTIGWNEVIARIEADIKANKTLANAQLPKWIKSIPGPYKDNSAYAPGSYKWMPPEINPKQPFPMLVGQKARALDIVFENKGAMVYKFSPTMSSSSGQSAKHAKSATGPSKEALIVSFKTKMCTINEQVLTALNKALDLAEQKKYLGVIVWQKDSDNFSAGADLLTLAGKFEVGGIATLEKILQYFQKTMLRIRYANVPVVTAVRGYAFGGGCELVMHSHKTVAALESYIGLVEVGVGLIPGAGGTKEMAYRASKSSDPEKTLQQYFKQIGMAEVAKSAYLAKHMGYLREDDVIIMNPYELVFYAYQELNNLAKDFKARKPETFMAQGLPAYGNLMAAITNLEIGNFASQYDAIIAEKLAHVITGGAIDPGPVDEAWMLRLERQAFLSLVIDRRTQQRILHLMKTGKPLRN